MKTKAFPLPLANTYWVIPGSLLAGEHPWTSDEAEARTRLAALSAAGIDYFVDLTEAHEREDYRALLPPTAVYERYAIPDTWVPEQPAQMVRLQASLRAALQQGRRPYVHCRAGIGRTGMAVGCFLVEEGLNGKKALKRLNELWRQSARSKTWRRVPQTLEQADYVKAWPEIRISVLSQGMDS